MSYQQTQAELQSHFDEQLGFLSASCDAYDQGNHAEAKRLAATLRVLLHHTDNSTSLLEQLGQAQRQFLSTRAPVPSNPNVKTAYKGLIQVFLGDNSPTFYVPLDEAPDKNFLPFQDWWEEVVLSDSEGNHFTRKGLVLAVANKDGGAHIDPELPEHYAGLSRSNSLGNSMQAGGSDWEPLKTPELATVRQIGHEALKTLLPGYIKQPVSRGDGFVIGGFELHFS